MEDTHSRQPLLPPSAAAVKPVSSNAGIISRLFLVAFIGVVSIWANHEASKGYAITLVNESATTLAGARFQLFYVSNEEATRVVIKASNSIENFLYPYSNSSIKKPIKSVIIRLAADRNLTDNVVVEPGSGLDQFVLNISPSIMGGTHFGHDVDVALRRGVARMWLWDGQGSSPQNLINAIVEYLVSILNGSIDLLEPTTAVCWDPDDGRAVAEFVNYGERRRPGFIRRLNRAMKDGWNDEKLGAALGMSVHKLCATSESLRYNSSSV